MNASTKRLRRPCPDCGGLHRMDRHRKKCAGCGKRRCTSHDESVIRQGLRPQEKQEKQVDSWGRPKRQRTESKFFCSAACADGYDVHGALIKMGD